MQRIYFSSIIFAISTVSSLSFAAQSEFRKKTHLLPDAPSSVYFQALKVSPLQSRMFIGGVTQEAISLGEKNMVWLKYMNSFRGEENQLRLTKPGQLNGIPITKPNRYNPETVKAETNAIKKDIPAEMLKVLTGSKEMPQNPMLDEETYILWAKRVDKNYQTAVRWTLMEPYLTQLADERSQDVRGYYYLNQMQNLENILRAFNSQPIETQNDIKEWLRQICVNSAGLSAGCDKKVATSIQSQKVYELYLKYMPGGQKTWDSYFKLYNPRPEMEWTDVDSSRAILPFRDPTNTSILNFLKLNIEDEWKWDGWTLGLDFRGKADVHVEFVPGVTPHVNGVGGNTITMDDNAPLSEWDVQWTIRHEFGHVLGFVDCYVEFYDPTEKIITNYQLDIDNLMCSRKGRLQKTHFETMKAAYLKR